jgi:hypothetical protein
MCWHPDSMGVVNPMKLCPLAKMLRSCSEASNQVSGVHEESEDDQCKAERQVGQSQVQRKAVHAPIARRFAGATTCPLEPTQDILEEFSLLVASN